MLDPDYILHVSEGAEEISELLHTEIINRIVERIMVRVGRGEDYLLTATDKWNIEVLQDAGYLMEDIQREIAKRTRQQEREIKAAMEEAGVNAMAADDAIYQAAGISTTPLNQSPYLVRLMERNYNATLGEFNNFTRTMANEAQADFIRAVDKAYALTASGSISYSQAVKEALDDIVSNGVVVAYPSGRKDTIETATLRAVRTGIAQSSAAITLERMDEMGVSLVLVSSHLGARVTKTEDYTNHAWWQGKVYHVDWADVFFLENKMVAKSREEYDGKYPDFVETTGYGKVDGLCGANCRHNISPYFEGMENLFYKYDSEENKKAYELSQRQRAMERKIRDTKRQCMNWKAAYDNAENEEVKASVYDSYQKKAVLLQKQNNAYNQFCEENNLKRRADRIAIAKWDRKQAAAATAAARRRANGE